MVVGGRMRGQRGPNREGAQPSDGAWRCVGEVSCLVCAEGGSGLVSELLEEGDAFL